MDHGDVVLYVYRCSSCGSRGQVHLPGDGHDGELATCDSCEHQVELEWDGGVTLEASASASNPGQPES